MKTFLLIAFSIFAELAFGQADVTIETQYTVMSDGELTEQVVTFSLFENQGILRMQDKKSKYSKDFYVKYRNTMHDNGGYYHIVYESDAVKHRMKNLPQGELGVFSFFYVEKGGDLMGLRIILLKDRNPETFLTNKGALVYLSGRD